jgi:hypothetical protein
MRRHARFVAVQFILRKMPGIMVNARFIYAPQRGVNGL